jgi:hypothetical protein
MFMRGFLYEKHRSVQQQAVGIQNYGVDVTVNCGGMLMGVRVGVMVGVGVGIKGSQPL